MTLAEDLPRRHDELLWNDWHPVAFSHQIPPGGHRAARLLEEEIVVWRDDDGSIHAWDDRCPHRGARLSLGGVVGGNLTCPYHGWRFDGAGRCTLKPAQPSAPLPAESIVRSFAAEEHHGLVWVCLGSPSRPVIPYEEFDDPRLRNIMAGPYAVNACAPRVVENFIDMAHFSFVHEGILGHADLTEIPEYRVEPFVDGSGQAGVRAVGMRVLQPQANLQATGPADVEYGYRISRPLAAILTKQIVGADVAEAITLFIQPVSEAESQVWMVFSGVRSPEPDEAVRDFQDTVFAQDKPILESQRPQRLPLQTRSEQAQRADLLSAHYRRYLKEQGLTYGVTP
ncbi:aromatic ring-hydroxylating dioxygenase subunit alpha [Xylophilus sp. GOD-11R]|uniref:aromatic ring-hydroxylating dioxygenase subunit alpha n=1 Tax=Xylophilus sp. GOD-11R TaxID=3089814 RepID=UPI00298D486F|nr:aromatic ring-hydroxylating dioxygenase subunit alpha [Xylophilus sp. GOD-11R]WPB55165.1 aromatic ring-hydroxylating dioxygenase subunit alpha [Xylophilus sp. GOD-11R]